MHVTETAIPLDPVTLSEGDEMPPSTFGPLTRTDFVRYAGAGGDFNPIHHDEAVARSAGMPSVFGMGMLHAGVLGIRLARWVGPRNVRSFSVRFTGQVWPGDELTLSGRVRRIEAGGTRRVAHLDLAVTRETGEVVLTASSTADVAPVE